MKRSILRCVLAVVLAAAFLSFAPFGADSRTAGTGALFGAGDAAAEVWCAPEHSTCGEGGGFGGGGGGGGGGGRAASCRPRLGWDCIVSGIVREDKCVHNPRTGLCK